jgi:hypothetical protein
MKYAPLYTTSLGAWGDMFVCYANIWLLTNRINRKVSVLHYGTDPEVAKFLEYQDNIEEVRFESPENEDEYQAVIKEAKMGKEWAKRIFKEDGFVFATHLDAEMILNFMIARRFEYRLPVQNPPMAQKTILINPFSFQSCLPQSHWPWIPEAVQYLIDKTDWNFILVGLDKTRYSGTNEYFDFPLEIEDHPRVLNLVGKTKSMLEVLALAEQCEGIVTTSNALSMWSIISNKPALVWAHKKLTNPIVPGHEYYKEWIQAEPNQIIWWGQPLDDFKKECDRWLDALAAKAI